MLFPSPPIHSLLQAFLLHLEVHSNLRIIITLLSSGTTTSDGWNVVWRAINDGAWRVWSGAYTGHATSTATWHAVAGGFECTGSFWDDAACWAVCTSGWRNSRTHGAEYWRKSRVKRCEGYCCTCRPKEFCFETPVLSCTNAS